MLNKLISITSAALLFCGVAFADQQTFTIGANTQSNILNAPMKLLSLTVLATNAVTLNIYDAPGNTTTNIVGAYSNLVQYATNVSQTYTDFFGKPTTNWLTNALVMTTNSVPSKTNNYTQVFSMTFGSNTTTVLSPLSINFANGILVTNASGNTVVITPQYTGN